MANTKFGLTNLLTQAGVIMKNGTGGGAPALIESAPFTMAQLLNGDRYSFWKSSTLTTPTQYAVDFFLPAPASINAAAVHGFRLATGQGPFVDVSYQASGYTPGGAWNFLGSIVNLVQNPRDDGVEFATVSAQSIRYLITPGVANTVISIGKFLVASLVDLGMGGSPGSGILPFRNRSVTPQEGGSFVITERGDEGMDITLQFKSIPLALTNTLLGLEAIAGTFLLKDIEGRFLEVFLRDGKVKVDRSFNGLYDVTVDLQRAP